MNSVRLIRGLNIYESDRGEICHHLRSIEFFFRNEFLAKVDIFMNIALVVSIQLVIHNSSTPETYHSQPMKLL
jgi:hypothetical protein